LLRNESSWAKITLTADARPFEYRDLGRLGRPPPRGGSE
jgi:hypothetical protein